MIVEWKLICMILPSAFAVSLICPDNLPEILCFISYLKVSSFMWLFRSHYLAKVGQNWLNWQNCLNGDINKAPPLPTNTICLTICRLRKKHLVPNWAWSMVKFLWRCLLFSAMRYRCFLDTRSCAALWAADLDWIVGPGCSAGGYFLGCSQRLALCRQH